MNITKFTKNKKNTFLCSIVFPTYYPNFRSTTPAVMAMNCLCNLRLQALLTLFVVSRRCFAWKAENNKDAHMGFTASNNYTCSALRDNRARKHHTFLYHIVCNATYPGQCRLMPLAPLRPPCRLAGWLASGLAGRY